jgi:hypothetical protein
VNRRRDRRPRAPTGCSSGHADGRGCTAGGTLDIWDDYFPAEKAERQLATAVDLGHHGELFEYDAGEGRLTLPS